MLCCGRTDIGQKRKVNQDSFVCEKFDNGMGLAVVCDGMGGVAGGGIAGCLACYSFSESIAAFAESFGKREKLSRVDERKIKVALADAVKCANDAVLEKSKSDESLAGMGTTLVAVLYFCKTLFCVNVGDSRMYLFHKGHGEQITHDHSFVQYLVDTGRMTPEEARTSPRKNMITRAVGTDSELEADIFVKKLPDADKRTAEYVAVLCSDGLSNHLSKEEIAEDIEGVQKMKTDRGLGAFCEKLIDSANLSGGSDNITAVIVTA